MHACTHTRIHTHTHTGPGWLMDTRRTCSSSYPPVDFVMPQFLQHKSDYDRWHSQPFYSQPGGYKLCLGVDAGGSGSGVGTHVSVLLFLMKGENDHQLRWPFEHDVMVKILNWQRNDNHVIITISFKNAPTASKQRVISRNLALEWGEFQAIPISSVSKSPYQDTQYLQNDCLYLQVLKVEPPKI